MSKKEEKIQAGISLQIPYSMVDYWDTVKVMNNV